MAFDIAEVLKSFHCRIDAFATDIAQRDRRPFFEKAARGRQTDALRRTGHDAHLAQQTLHLTSLLSEIRAVFPASQNASTSSRYREKSDSSWSLPSITCCRAPSYLRTIER
jgi:hypothetical protein